MHKNGFSLIELLVAVAILGILAAVGISSYTGYIATARASQATTGLSSIYLAQEEFRSINRSYFPLAGAICDDNTDNTIVINGDPVNGGGLFSGAQTLSRENFVFCIEAAANSNIYQAFAYSNRNNDVYSITNNNVKASQVDGVRTDTEGW
jgi:prepilin-type N-terminal cleavage/methylation domain-containing protein